MAVWAIGDIQGCYDELAMLIERFEDVPADITVERFADLADRCLVQCLCDLGSVATLGEPAHVATDVGGIGIL